MKNISTFTLILFCLVAKAQEKTKPDTTTFRWANNRVILINHAPDSLPYDYDLNYPDSLFNCEEDKVWPKFLVEVGTNGYVSTEGQLDLPEEQSLMDIDYGRSRSFGFAFQFKGIDKNSWYITPGLGLTWNGYHFENNIKIIPAGQTTEFIEDSTVNNSKYKLRATYLEIPLLFGIRIGKGERPLNIQTGLVGSMRIGSMVKQHFESGGIDQQVKYKDDFNLSPYKLEGLIRVGSNHFSVFARYSFTTLFKRNSAFAVHPFAAGITIGGVK